MPDQSKKEGPHQPHPLANAAEAARLLGALRGSDPLTALGELGGWLESAKDLPDEDDKKRAEILAAVQDASEPHLAALTGQFVGQAAGSHAMRESKWTGLNDYLRGLTGALFATATRLLRDAAGNAALQPAAAAVAARTLHACRLLAKSYLLRYQSVPPKVWRLAYTVHAHAEDAGCAAAPVRLHGTYKTSSSANAELLRLLLLQVGAPDMLPPEQIEIADRAAEQFGGDFVLRPPSAQDNPFIFHPGSDAPPQRAPDTPPPAEQGYRYFGAGMGYGALEKLNREFAKATPAEPTPLGKDIPVHAQAAALRHLAAFWGPFNPYAPPARSPASGTLPVVQGFGQVWQQLSSAGTGKMELSLVEESETPAAQATGEQAWPLRDTGGNELGVEVPQAAADLARCGALLAVKKPGDSAWSLAVIRSMHAEPEQPLVAHIAILSSSPRVVRLLPHGTSADVTGHYSAEAMRQFATYGGGVRAIILSDGGGPGVQAANLMIPPDQWKAGRLYETTVGTTQRLLRGLQLLRRGDDYVRATFEWAIRPPE